MEVVTAARAGQEPDRALSAGPLGGQRTPEPSGRPSLPPAPLSDALLGLMSKDS